MNRSSPLLRLASVCLWGRGYPFVVLFWLLVALLIFFLAPMGPVGPAPKKVPKDPPVGVNCALGSPRAASQGITGVKRAQALYLFHTPVV